MKLLVVGASAGIGRAVAVEAVKRGHAVAAAARRPVEIEGAIALSCDITDPAQCQSVVDETVRALGGLDALVVAAGASPLSRVEDAGEELWREVVDTNLVGAALLTRAALPHIGRALYMSVTSPGRPWPWLVPYFASKAGMEELVRGLRAEHPEVGFITVSVGPTVSEFASGWDEAAAGQAFAQWDKGGYLAQGGVMAPDEVAAVMLDALAAPVHVDELKLMPQSEKRGGT